MITEELKYIAGILDVTPEFLAKVEDDMRARGFKNGAFEKVASKNREIVDKKLMELGLSKETGAEEISLAFRNVVRTNEQQLLKYLRTVPGNTEFEKAITLAKRIASVGSGFFLKKSYGEEILRKSRPERLLEFFKYKDVDELLKHHDVTEVFSVLRFIESDQWMHETFEKAYSDFNAFDFEEREIEVKVLGPEWHDVAIKFVAKKHHNVSHLKEFGVIFLNPIKENVPGKFLRDFALFMHYFHEIQFYSKLFKRYSLGPDFPTHLKSLLRGDVLKRDTVSPGEWLIVQRYLFKDDPSDPRLFIPRVNPESVHWFRGERDLARLSEEEPDLKFELWHNLDWVGQAFSDGEVKVVSFDLEDNAMSEVAASEGRKEILRYHQREAMWTRLFMEYVGGEMEMEHLLIENFDKGAILFKVK